MLKSARALHRERVLSEQRLSWSSQRSIDGCTMHIVRSYHGLTGHCGYQQTPAMLPRPTPCNAASPFPPFAPMLCPHSMTCTSTHGIRNCFFPSKLLIHSLPLLVAAVVAFAPILFFMPSTALVAIPPTVSFTIDAASDAVSKMASCSDEAESSSWPRLCALRGSNQSARKSKSDIVRIIRSSEQ